MVPATHYQRVPFGDTSFGTFRTSFCPAPSVLDISVRASAASSTVSPPVPPSWPPLVTSAPGDRGSVGAREIIGLRLVRSIGGNERVAEAPLAAGTVRTRRKE